MEIVRVCVVVQMKNLDSHPSQKIISNPSEFEYGVIDVEKEF